LPVPFGYNIQAEPEAEDMAHNWLRIPDEKAPDGTVSLHYEDMGRGDPALVFVHGLGADHIEFDFQMDFFAPRHRCVALDQRGFGRTAPTGELSIRQSISDLSLLVDALGLERFILVGHSMGTMVSYGYILENPERVERLAIIGGTAAIKQNPAIYLGMLMLPLARPLLPDSLKRWLLTQLALNVSTLGAKARASRILKHYLKKNPRMFTDEFYDVCMDYTRHITQFDYRGRLKEIKCPVLLVHGALDIGITVNAAIAARMAIPNASLRIMPDCGHSPNVEEPANLNRLLDRFFEASRNGNGGG
jgi:pimeloyl-ACP methyl ester carboxylesterase